MHLHGTFMGWIKTIFFATWLVCSMLLAGREYNRRVARDVELENFERAQIALKAIELKGSVKCVEE